MYLYCERFPSRPRCKLGKGKRRKSDDKITRFRHIYYFQCDICNDIFARTKKRNIEYHFCSRKCVIIAQQKGNILYNKINNTTLERLGVTRGFNQPNMIEKNIIASHSKEATQKRKQSIKKFHENKPIDWYINTNINKPDVCIRRHNTMKRNKTYKTSQPEEIFYKLLCEKFNINDIERQKNVNHWLIDFYIKSIDTYIQIDGIYWHGLNRPIDKIMEFKSPRDKIIYKTWCRDKDQNDWFKTNNLKLLRITDKQIKVGDYEL